MHTLFESGVTRIHELERYISDDVVRYGNRLTELEKKLTAAYEEAVCDRINDSDVNIELFADDRGSLGR